MRVSNQDSFLKGATILGLANLLNRALALVYKPVMSRVFAKFDGAGGNVGVGLANMPMSTLALILAVTATGWNIVVSELVAERTAQGDNDGAVDVLRTSLKIGLFFSSVVAVLFYVLAENIAGAKGDPRAALGFQVISPGIVFLSLEAIYRGYLQGKRQVVPTALAQLINQTVRVGFGLVFLLLLAPMGVWFSAAGFNLGITIGGIAGVGYLFFLTAKDGLWRSQTANTPWSARVHLAKRVVGNTIPVVALAICGALFSEIDNFLIVPLMSKAGAPTLDGLSVLGQLVNALSIVLLPSILSWGLYLNLLPSIKAAVAVGDYREISKLFRVALRTVLFVGLPATVLCLVAAEEIYTLLFGTTVGADALRVLALSVLPLMLQHVTNGILQGFGRWWLPVLGSVFGLTVKAATIFAWAHRGAPGASWGTVLGYAVASCVTLAGVVRLTLTVNWVDLLLRSLGGSVVMAVVIYAIKGAWFGSGVGTPIQSVLVISFGGVTYLMASLVTGSITRSELARLPVVGRPVSVVIDNLVALTRAR